MEVAGPSKPPDPIQPPDEPRRPKKRTKTGCQTCRQRRIKCDEGKPACEKCLRGNRPCLYGKPEVRFKEPYHTLDATFPDNTVLAMENPQLAEAQRGGPSAQGQLLAPIAPKPPGRNRDRTYSQTEQFDYDDERVALRDTAQLPVLPTNMGGMDQLAATDQYRTQLLSAQFNFSQQGENVSGFFSPYSGNAGDQGVTADPYPNMPNDRNFAGSNQQPQFPPYQVPFGGSDMDQGFGGLFNAVTGVFGSSSSCSNSGPGLSAEGELNMQIDPPLDLNQDFPLLDLPNDAIGNLEPNPLLLGSAQNTPMSLQATPPPWTQPRLSFTSAPLRWPTMAHPGSLIQEPHVRVWPEDRSIILTNQHVNHLGDSTLDYTRSFIETTGPSLSMYERVSFKKPDGDVELRNDSIGRSLWNYTLPMMATQDATLNHAIQALGSLSYAKKHKDYEGLALTDSQRRYNSLCHGIEAALRPGRRGVRGLEYSPATVAACLLAGYYNIWKGSQRAWCQLLSKAGSMLQELQLRTISRRCLPARVLKQPLIGDDSIRERCHGNPIPSLDPLYRTSSVDYETLSHITGLPTDTDMHGLDDPYTAPPDVSVIDIQDYEVLRDLFWWYCKMDAYQSMLGGSRLYMMYQNWLDCPPRGPLGRADQIYGTYDHLVLLLGRVADFGARDQRRKLRIFKKSQTNRSPGHPGLMVNPPMDETQNTYLFAGEVNEQRRREEAIAENRTEAEAMQEWLQIHNAFEFFLHQVYLAFDTPCMTFNTVFDGPALQYGRPEVAGIWLNYHMGKILKYRHHPGNPYAALEATVRAFPHTKTHADRIGRIAAGIAGDLTGVTAVDSTTSAALIETAFCLFIAAPQFETQEQKLWMLQTMDKIEQLAGWQSAGEIAGGCETIWSHLHLVDPSLPRYHPSGQIRRRVQGPALERRLDKAFQENSRFRREDRAEIAMGLTTLPQDMSNLNIQDP